MAIATFGAEHGWPGRCWTRPASSLLAQDSTRLRFRSARLHWRAHLDTAANVGTRGGAPVSDPAVPAQDRAMLPDRRPALRWSVKKFSVFASDSSDSPSR